MNCILDAFDLFKTNGCAAWALSAIAFAVGAVAGLLACNECCLGLLDVLCASYIVRILTRECKLCKAQRI